MNLDIQKIIDDALAGGGNISRQQIKVTVNGKRMNLNDNDSDDDDDDGPVKCPRCGNIKSGISNICDSCQYIFESDLLKSQLEELRGLITELKNFRKGTPDDYNELLTDIDSQIETITMSYGNNPEIKSMLQSHAKEKETIVKAHKSKKQMSGILSKGLLIFTILGITTYIMQRPDKAPTTSEKIEQYIKEKNIGKAKALLPNITGFAEKTNFQATLQQMELDSLIGAKDYDGALEVVNLEPSVIERDTQIEKILTIEITELIKSKEFDKARKRVEIIDDTYSRDKLKEKISLAEKLKK